MYPRTSSGNLITHAAADEIMTLFDKIMSVVEPQSNKTFADLCFKTASGQCVTSGLPRMLGGSRSAFQAAHPDDEAVRQRAALPFYPDSGGKEPVRRDAVFAEPVVNGTGTSASLTATATKFSFYIVGTNPESNGGKSTLLDWEQAVVDLFVSEKTHLVDQSGFKHIGLSLKVFKSIDDELARNVSGDIPLFASGTL